MDILPILILICREKSYYTLEAHAFVSNYDFYQGQCVIKQFLSLTSNCFVIEDFGVSTVWIATT